MIYMVEFRAMGCQVSIQLETDQDGAAILSRMPEQFEDIEACLTRFRPDSELMRFNARAGEWVNVSNVLFDNICAAKHAARVTDGCYNPLVLPAMIANGYDRSFEHVGKSVINAPVIVPDWQEIALRHDPNAVKIPAGSAIDLGGIAKGWTAAYLTDVLADYGACLVNIGGDMAGRGEPDALPGWRIDIEDPFTGDPFAFVYLHNSSLVTSGIDYRRWQDTNGDDHHHIIDPRHGQSAVTDVLTVTIMHPHAPTAEAYAKAVLLRGAEDGLNWLKQQWHTDGLVFQQDGAVLSTSTFTNLIYDRNLS